LASQHLVRGRRRADTRSGCALPGFFGMHRNWPGSLAAARRRAPSKAGSLRQGLGALPSLASDSAGAKAPGNGRHFRCRLQSRRLSLLPNPSLSRDPTRQAAWASWRADLCCTTPPKRLAARVAVSSNVRPQMPRPIFSLLLSCLALPVAAAPGVVPPEPLVSLGAEGSRSGHLIESKREEAFSVLEVRTSPRKDSDFSELVLKGMCAALESRSAVWVAARRIPGNIPTFRITFPASAKEADQSAKRSLVRSVSECRAVQGRTL
jgi:hypothetical protein